MSTEQTDGWGSPCVPCPDRMVTIRHRRHGLEKVPAYVFGVWAVHRSVQVYGYDPPDPDSFGVSHAPLGCSIGIAQELTFWDAIRIARALEDTAIATVDSALTIETRQIFEAAIGAALNDHYVWPLDSYMEAV